MSNVGIENEFSEDDNDIRELAERFAARRVRERVREIDQTDIFPLELYREAAELGLVSATAPADFGGSEMSEQSFVIALEALATEGAAFANGLLVSKLMAELINRLGTAEQKTIIGPMTRGEKVVSIAITEPDTGSDVSRLRTSARRMDDGWVLSGTKAWITKALVADVAVVLARTAEDQGSRSFTAFLVPRAVEGDASSGFTTGAKEPLMGMRGLATAPLILDDVRLPDTAVLGEVGRGFLDIMRSLDNGRIGVATLALGIAQRSLNEASSYAAQREAFGQPIDQFQSVQQMIARLAARIHAARLAVWDAAQAKDAGIDYTGKAAVAKLLASELAVDAARDAVQIHGGFGYSTHSEVERLYRDSKLMEIYEGTTQIQHSIIFRNLGVKGTR